MSTFAMTVYFLAGPVIAVAITVRMIVDARRERGGR
jgi:hypothetical protein